MKYKDLLLLTAFVDPESPVVIGVLGKNGFMTVPVQDVVMGYGREAGKIVVKPVRGLQPIEKKKPELP